MELAVFAGALVGAALGVILPLGDQLRVAFRDGATGASIHLIEERLNQPERDVAGATRDDSFTVPR